MYNNLSFFLAGKFFFASVTFKMKILHDKICFKSLLTEIHSIFRFSTVFIYLYCKISPGACCNYKCLGNQVIGRTFLLAWKTGTNKNHVTHVRPLCRTARKKSTSHIMYERNPLQSYPSCVYHLNL